MKKACSTLKKLKAKSSKNLINVNKELRTKKPNQVQDRGYKKYGQKMKELSVKLMYKIAQYMYT